MKMMEDVFLTDSIEIKTTPEKIFGFISNLVDDESYRAWHPVDHVSMRWTKGSPWQEGSIVYAVECFEGKPYKLKFLVTKVIPNRKIEYIPVSRFMRRYVPKNTFSMEPTGTGSVFTATVHLRLPLLPRLLAKKKVKRGLSGIRKHMRKEGENMKKILEAEE